MANRFFESRRYSLEKQIVELFFKFAVGASGAPTLDALNSKGIKSVARNSAGNYTVTLQDQYSKFLSLDAKELGASGIPAAPVVGVVSQAVGNSTPTVVVQFSSGGVATDPDSGSTIHGKIALGNTSAI